MRYLFAILLLAGCARFKTVQTDVSDENTKIRTITTRASAITFLAGKSSLASWKATQTDKTQGASVGGLEQEADAAKLAPMAAAIAEGVTKGLK